MVAPWAPTGVKAQPDEDDNSGALPFPGRPRGDGELHRGCDRDTFVERKRQASLLRDTTCRAICRVKLGLRQPGIQEDGKPYIPPDWDKAFKPVLGSYVKFLLGRPDQFRVVAGGGPGLYSVENVAGARIVNAPEWSDLSARKGKGKGKFKAKGKGEEAADAGKGPSGKAAGKGKGKGKVKGKVKGKAMKGAEEEEEEDDVDDVDDVAKAEADARAAWEEAGAWEEEAPVAAEPDAAADVEERSEDAVLADIATGADEPFGAAERPARHGSLIRSLLSGGGKRARI